MVPSVVRVYCHGPLVMSGEMTNGLAVLRNILAVCGSEPHEMIKLTIEGKA